MCLKRKGGCGYIAFIHLCRVCGIEENVITYFKERVVMSEETSLLDFVKWSEINGVEGKCIKCDKEHKVHPSIAHLSYHNYQHFVVIVEYNKYVTYYDIDGKKHKVLQLLFNKVFTGHLFHMSALKVL